MLFEWDEEKNAAHRRAHGLSFETAALVFLDGERIERFDREHSENEERLPRETLDWWKSRGGGYTSAMARVLDQVRDNAELLRQYL